MATPAPPQEIAAPSDPEAAKKALAKSRFTTTAAFYLKDRVAGDLDAFAERLYFAAIAGKTPLIIRQLRDEARAGDAELAMVLGLPEDFEPAQVLEGWLKEHPTP